MEEDLATKEEQCSDEEPEQESPVDEEVKEEEETLVPQPEVVFVQEEEETLVPQPELVEEEVENPATPMPEASPTSPEEEEAPHLPDAPPARILRHVDHIELMLDVMGLDGLFRNNPSSHWITACPLTPTPPFWCCGPILLQRTAFPSSWQGSWPICPLNPPQLCVWFSHHDNGLRLTLLALIYRFVCLEHMAAPELEPSTCAVRLD